MCGVHATQEAPCFQPLVVHGRACRSVPDGAGGPLRALPCPPMFRGNAGFRKTKRANGGRRAGKSVGQQGKKLLYPMLARNLATGT